MFHQAKVILLTITAVLLAQSSPTPTFAATNTSQGSVFYYGKQLTTDQLITIRAKGGAQDCTQQITEEELRTQQFNTYFCFDTYAEAIQNAKDLQPMVVRLNAILKASASTSKVTLPPPCSDSWGLFLGSLYTYFYEDLCNGGSASSIPSSGVYSITKNNSPHNLTLYMLANYGGFAYVMTGPAGILTPPPFGPASAKSAKVS